MDVSAATYLPQERSLDSLTEAAAQCRGCPLWERGTQTIFGEGRSSAQVMLVGEQPGDQEDLAGRPFVGAAGRLLDRALEQAGIVRAEVYVTNVVKHFKWVPKGKRRLHQSPNVREIGACLPWLEAELDLIRPRVLVCLGATAAKALLGRSFRVSTQHGTFVPSARAEFAMATLHPSAILRLRTSADRERALGELVADLAQITTVLGG